MLTPFKLATFVCAALGMFFASAHAHSQPTAAQPISGPRVPEPSSAAERQPNSDKVSAEVLFDQGVALMRAGNYDEACALLEQSETIDHGIGTMLYLAECYERSGRTASAWAQFRQAASMAAAAGHNERARAANERADYLAPTLSRLTIVIREPVEGLIVQRDGNDVPKSLWSTATPVDPGEHVLTVSAPGYVTWSTRVEVGPEGASVLADAPRLIPQARLAPAELVKEPVASSLVPLKEPREVRDDRRPLRRNPWLWTAVGVVAGGTVLTLALTLRPEEEVRTRGRYDGTSHVILGGP